MEVKGLERKDSCLLRVEAVSSLHRAGLMNMGPIMGRCAWKKPTQSAHKERKERKDEEAKSRPFHGVHTGMHTALRPGKW